MDEAFMPFHEVIVQMLSFTGRITDEEAGVTTTIYECEVESPIQLDVYSGDDEEAVTLGTTPPLHYVNTTFKTSFHQIRFKAVAEEGYGS